MWLMLISYEGFIELSELCCGRGPRGSKRTKIRWQPSSLNKILSKKDDNDDKTRDPFRSTLVTLIYNHLVLAPCYIITANVYGTKDNLACIFLKIEGYEQV
jgi:hypothetical protein